MTLHDAAALRVRIMFSWKKRSCGYEGGTLSLKQNVMLLSFVTRMIMNTNTTII